MPSPESPLPALLAVQHTIDSISHSKTNLIDINDRLTVVRTEQAQESQNHDLAQSLNNVLQQRTNKMHEDVENLVIKKPTEISAGIVKESKTRRIEYDRSMHDLVKAFNLFVSEHLARMLAAEDLGGPVVGEALDVNDSTLEAGFTQHGKAKKTPQESDKALAQRTKRNLQIWGNDHSFDDESALKGEADAAASSFRKLAEKLLNAAVSKDGSDGYIQIPKENAAVRFLVRSKVAQFHPEDARKLRLLDVGEHG